jgi:hypothetical protein
MAVTRTSVGTYISSAAALTVTFGTGAAAGDYALLIVETAFQAITTPSGWTAWVNNSGFGTPAAAGATGYSLYGKVITAGDISAGVAISDSGDHQGAVLITYSGVDTTTPVAGSAITAQSTATTAGASQALAGVTANDLVVSIICTDRDSATVSTNASAAWANATGSNSFIVNASTATGAGGGIIVNQLSPTAISGNVSFSCTITSSAYNSQTVALKAAAGSTTTVSPAKGSLVLSGHQPSVTVGFKVSPLVGHLVLGGKVPAVVTNFTVSPSTGHLVLSGKVPSLQVGTLVSPTSGHLVLGGKTPTITLAFTLAPAAGHLVLAGKTPTVTLTTALTPAPGHLSYTGHAPSIVVGTVVTPLTGHLQLTGYAPDVSGASELPAFMPLKVMYRHRNRVA